MRVLSVPHLTQVKGEESGIRRVVEAYFRHLPDFGVEFVAAGSDSYDLKMAHAGVAPDADLAVLHGIYFTADYEGAVWERKANQSVIASARAAKIVTVPSVWVAEVFQRDMRLSPEIVPHGIEWDSWQKLKPSQTGYMLWNKNRTGDVCDPGPMELLARSFPGERFIATFATKTAPANVEIIGLQPHKDMRRIIAGASVYLSTTKETFGIGSLEALACGVPVLGFAHGGNLDLVRHGETGYLARPGDIDDLAEGLHWCLANRQVLSDNAREAAKVWTWQEACRKMAALCQRATVSEPPTVAVVIPSYNYADRVGRAIESALAQNWTLLTEIIVVDDGSPDGGATERVVRAYEQRDRRVRYIHQENRGVAHARNAGIAATTAKYVCPLDADDAIEPEFLSVCIGALERDRSLGIAYTALQWIKPDGSRGVSAWPGEWDFNKQLLRQNQVPTCCVFRRQMWEQLGGYRQRYAPGGAGSEDAEFWTRAGAYGWGAVKADRRPLFVYSWMSGHVTGKKDYREPDWLGWHPWVKDEQHPFASLATPRRFSHSVRQYDEPVVSIVIPVGPGHEQMLIDALDGLEAQSFRKWEAVVVWTVGSEIPHRKAYPYVHWLEAPQVGAGEARNRGAAIARAPFLVFLDADDWLYPEALKKMLEAWESSEAIIYTDYVGKATVDDPKRLAQDLQDRLYAWDPAKSEAVIGYRAANYEPDRAQRQPEGERPYLWANVTTLVPRAWHQEIGGFDEAMPSWEDVDYHWRMARAGKCYHRIAEELMVYRFYTGSRRQSGLQQYPTLVEYLRRKYRSIQTVPCNCGSNGRNGKSAPPAAAPQALVTHQGGNPMADEDFVMARYLHPNRGRHRVIGTETRTDYGYRKGGDTFLVHRRDLTTQPHLFMALERPAAVQPPRPSAPLPPPAPRMLTPEPPTGQRIFPAPRPPTGAEQPFDLQKLPGVTKQIAASLREAGIDTPDKIVEAGIDRLVQLKWIGEARAEMIVRSVHALKAMAAEVEPA